MRELLCDSWLRIFQIKMSDVEKGNLTTLSFLRFLQSARATTEGKKE
jgi:hypothetical protein